MLYRIILIQSWKMSDGFIEDDLMVNCFVRAWKTEKSNYSSFQKKNLSLLFIQEERIRHSTVLKIFYKIKPWVECFCLSFFGGGGLLPTEGRERSCSCWRALFSLAERAQGQLESGTLCAVCVGFLFLFSCTILGSLWLYICSETFTIRDCYCI